MTKNNEQIIIDGVDVSGCGELTIQEDKLFICEITGYLCDDRQNCYYKQLKQCEELKADIKDIANLLDLDTGEEYNFGNIEMEIKELKTENEELKKELESTKGLVTVGNKQLTEALGKNEELTSKCSQQEEEIKDLTAKNNEYIDENHELVVQVKILKFNRLNMFEHLDIVQENNKLKQTLAEIKEIAEDFYLDGEYVKDKYLAQDILQKISKCEGNNG